MNTTHVSRSITIIICILISIGVPLLSRFALADCPNETPVVAPCIQEFDVCLDANPCTTQLGPDGSPDWDSTTEQDVNSDDFGCKDNGDEETECLTSTTEALCFTQYGCQSTGQGCVINPNIRRNKAAFIKEEVECEGGE